MGYYIFHSGIKGQKWGVRRFQNEDGSLTAAGKERYLHNGIKLGSSTQANHEKDKSTDTKARAFQMKFTQYFKDKGINASNAQTYDHHQDLINDPVGWRKSKDNLLNSWMQSRIDSYIKSKATNGSRLLENKVHNNFNEFSDQDYYRLQGELEEERRENTEKYGKEVAQYIYDVQNQYLKEYQKKHNTHTHGVIENASSGMPTSAISEKQKAEAEELMKKNIPASAWNQRVKELNRK